MRISFDLDKTLIPAKDEFPVEEQGFFRRLFGIEKIRRGSIELMKRLSSQGHEIYIYTTSYRSQFKIRLMFWSYGIKIHGVVNQQENQEALKRRKIFVSKYPPAFGIQLHVDDLPGVKLEAEKYKFRVVIVSPGDENWADKVTKEMKKI